MSDLKSVLLEEFEDEEYAHAYCDEFLNTYIATQLKALREQRQWRQEDVAQRAGMKQPRIALLENINYASWNIRTLRALARAFDVRLKVSFEEFSTIIEDVRAFSRVRLERTSRSPDLARAKAIARGTDAVIDLSKLIQDKNRATQLNSPVSAPPPGSMLVEPQPQRAANFSEWPLRA